MGGVGCWSGAEGGRPGGGQGGREQRPRMKAGWGQTLGGGGRGEPDLGHEQYHQSDVGGEHYGEGREGKGGVLLAGQDHGDGGGDEAQDLRANELGTSGLSSPRTAHEDTCRHSYPATGAQM